MKSWRIIGVIKNMFDLIYEINRLEEKYGDAFNWGADINREYFQKQLARETNLTLYKEVKALAKCYSNDDVLFLLDDKVYRIYHLTYSNGEARYIDLDYAFFCCDGVYNMDVKEAIECAKTVGAKHSIPYHMIPADKTNCFDQNVAESFDVPERIILRPGEELVLE